jgi:hypothetical protein
MACPVERGGYVITTDTNNIVGRIEVNDRVLGLIIQALDIPTRAPHVLDPGGTAQIKSVYVYRGGMPKPRKK